MFLYELELQSFRCFNQKKLTFTKPITFVIGTNGIGKTSVLEAIHYLCYFKSFRSHIISDVIQSGSESFFLKGVFDRTYDFEKAGHIIQVGYSGQKKSIKLDQKNVTSYKQIMTFFQVITLTEDDIDLIKGYPAQRRAFIDQAVLLSDYTAFDLYTSLRKVLAHRNSLLAHGRNIDLIELEIWTQSLWKITVNIQKLRVEALSRVVTSVNKLLSEYFDGIYEVNILYEYKYTNSNQSYEDFSRKMSHLIDQELVMKRSLFGAHLDDLKFQIRGKRAKIFASRGQQKLISLLCKLSLATLRVNEQDFPIILIDDFISDFDKIRLKQLATFFQKCQNQIIMTAPFCDLELRGMFNDVDLELITL
ncbi:DNA replication/repair protein RecF [Candidatus Dependentiae bacterium]|nr:DNA replication/repair protein RecF [Candidatus Dependentiae bacterium]